ncbi:unnamed protein product [Soboliphyme baturini]|uniref:Protein kinase domain-containing protein n=1 Tax=Soboliphyme baturini TaxID=241478 RepID=A0A183J3Z7_9BILA|nr:unnamed protein product [Soboliphyme baturini]
MFRIEDLENGHYILKDEILGQGAFAVVKSCISRLTGEEFAVKIINKDQNRLRVLKEIQTFHLCMGHPNIVQLIEYFEDDNFYLVFEKMRGGPLLDHIQRRICFTELEASMVVRDVAHALQFLHRKSNFMHFHIYVAT